MEVRDRSGQFAHVRLTLDIAAISIGFDPEKDKLRFATDNRRLSDACVGKEFSEALGVLGGIEPYEITASGLPPGLALVDGQIQGTIAESAVPTGQASQEYQVSVTVLDQQSALLPAERRVPRLEANFSLSVRALLPIRIAGLFPPTARVGLAYMVLWWRMAGMVNCAGEKWHGSKTMPPALVRF